MEIFLPFIYKKSQEKSQDLEQISLYIDDYVIIPDKLKEIVEENKTTIIEII